MTIFLLALLEKRRVVGKAAGWRAILDWLATLLSMSLVTGRRFVEETTHLPLVGRHRVFRHVPLAPSDRREESGSVPDFSVSESEIFDHFLDREIDPGSAARRFVGAIGASGVSTSGVSAGQSGVSGLNAGQSGEGHAATAGIECGEGHAATAGIECGCNQGCLKKISCADVD